MTPQKIAIPVVHPSTSRPKSGLSAIPIPHRDTLPRLQPQRTYELPHPSEPNHTHTPQSTNSISPRPSIPSRDLQPVSLPEPWSLNIFFPAKSGRHQYIKSLNISSPYMYTYIVIHHTETNQPPVFYRTTHLIPTNPFLPPLSPHNSPLPPRHNAARTTYTFSPVIRHKPQINIVFSLLASPLDLC